MPVLEQAIGSRYEIRLVHPSGYYISAIDTFLDLTYTMVLNDVGTLTLTLASNFASVLLVPDARIEVWRSVGQGSSYLEGDTQWFITKITEEVDDNGGRTYKVFALSANCILDRRIVAYYADSGYDYGALPADNFMKLIVKQNYGALALDSARNISSILSVENDVSGGATIYASFAWKNVLDTLREIANASYQVGPTVYFDIVVTTPPTGLTFRTYVTQRGTDRRATSANRLILGYDYGTIGAYTIEDDYTDEATYIYAGGPGEDSLQLVAQLEDTTRSARSPFGRKELWIDANQAVTSLQLTGAAQAALIANRPRKTFQGKILNTPASIYGLHWRWGDYVTVQANINAFDCRIVAVHVTVQGNQTEDIDAVLRSDT